VLERQSSYKLNSMRENTQSLTGQSCQHGNLSISLASTSTVHLTHTSPTSRPTTTSAIRISYTKLRGFLYRSKHAPHESKFTEQNGCWRIGGNFDGRMDSIDNKGAFQASLLAPLRLHLPQDAGRRGSSTSEANGGGSWTYCVDPDEGHGGGKSRRWAGIMA